MGRRTRSGGSSPACGGRRQRRERTGIRGGADELVDVAFLELESAVATTTGRSFILVRTLDPFYQEAASDLAFVYGYPWPVEMLEKGATGRDASAWSPSLT